jgi:hypothetical protein
MNIGQKEKVYVTPSPQTYKTIYVTPELSKTNQITP